MDSMSQPPQHPDEQHPDEQDPAHTPSGAKDDRWERDHAADIPRTASGGLPPAILITSIVIFVIGFFLFRRWRSQYVDYGSGSSDAVQQILAGVGLG